MQITFRKTSDRTLETTVLRDDGVTVQLRGSCRKSELPHDLSHYMVETELGLERGFWGCIGKGGALFGDDRGLGKAAAYCEPKISGADPRDVPGTRRVGVSGGGLLRRGSDQGSSPSVRQARFSRS